MEAPEKIFICDYGSEVSYEWHSESEFEAKGHNDIEYTRTDAFIEKACQWLEDNKDHPFIGCEDHELAGFLTNEFIEDFKNYMKGK